jgi:hypothetical protein
VYLHIFEHIGTLVSLQKLDAGYRQTTHQPNLPAVKPFSFSYSGMNIFLYCNDCASLGEGTTRNGGSSLFSDRSVNTQISSTSEMTSLDM